MTQTNRFATTLETLTEIAPEFRAMQTDASRALPSLSEVLTEFSPMPRAALFIGLATDGLPVLLNLQDPRPGPLLVIGGAGSQKTALLQVVARSVDQLHEPKDVKYGVISPHPDEWKTFASAPNCAKVMAAQDAAVAEYLTSLVEWARLIERERRYILLFIDDLEALSHFDSDSDVQQNLRWLLLRGPSRGVWPLVTLNASRAEQLRPWLEAFRTRIFGHIESRHLAESLRGSIDPPFGHLIANSQFVIRDGNSWLPFWIPKLD